ncbi:hypothetical protein POM88_011679 [Heracleum sosnowskyi]|uniref:DUF4378 domain-containing protein n=1 Tax=Heracleum sosnowskyi TaxID=360622 RepID=A0AAD8IX88_9APIA|nr:hypothetical protein POM88_011679 [Heracleum sosnowskyi]
MDRLRRLRKSKSSAKNDQGDHHVHKEKSKSKLSSSSLVARLMRFDGLKSQKLIHRQHKRFVEHTLSETRPIALQGDACLFEGESHKKRLTEQPECKDIFEDKGSKSGSNKDAILELLKKPNPLFLKHPQGVQESSSSSLCSHLPIPKQSNPENFEAKDQNVERNTLKKHNIGSKKTHEDGILNQSFTLAGTPNHPEPSKFSGEEKEGTDKGTSRIVILKPNYAMAREARNSSSSHDPSFLNISGSRKSRGHMNHRTKDEDFVETIDFINGVEVSASRVREAKIFAKKIFRELSETTGIMNDTEAKEASESFNKEVQEVFSRLRTDFPDYVQEIPGTGGLHDFSRIDSASESEVMKMTSYDSTESFISRQTKKRLLERWRRAQRHARAGGRGSTLGEMLCISEEKIKNLDAAERDSPLGISSADGWKDKYSRIRPRSRSVPPPPGTRNEILYAEREYRIDDKLLMPKEVRHRSQSEMVHGNFTENEKFSSKTSRSSKRKSQSRRRRASNSNALLKNHISRNEKDIVKKYFPEENPLVSPTRSVTSTIGTGALSVYSDACYSDIPRSLLKRHDSSRGRQEHSHPKLGSEVESSGRLKEADPSPISVVEVPSREELSSGLKCFKQVSAEIHDLQKQLSPLSRESKTNCDVPMHFKTDFSGEESILAVDANEIAVSDWEYFYIADVLIECGLYDMDADIFMQSFKGPNLPLGPWVFHNLEKKYSDEISAPKYERMLLFDRIRSAVQEISQSCMYLCPWVKPVTAEFGLKWPKRKLRNEVHKFLEIQDVEVIERISGKETGKGEDWGDLRNSVDMIGTIIERSLTNDLLMELVMELQFVV